MKSALETTGLSKRYGSTWALRDCSLRIPNGRIVALVGFNGAGKTTLLHLAMGLLKPTSGRATVLGWSALANPTCVLASVGFIAQDRPLYKRLTVDQMLGFGAHLNPRWDDRLARERLQSAGVPLNRKVGELSGGQQAQVALALLLAKRPELLLLDEPVSNLDPLARREFTKALLDAAAADGLTVVFSSHVVAELERFCDYLVILAGGQVQVAGDVDEILETHKVLTGRPHSVDDLEQDPSVVFATTTRRQTTLVVRSKRQPTGRHLGGTRSGVRGAGHRVHEPSSGGCSAAPQLEVVDQEVPA